MDPAGRATTHSVKRSQRTTHCSSRGPDLNRVPTFGELYKEHNPFQKSVPEITAEHPSRAALAAKQRNNAASWVLKSGYFTTFINCCILANAVTVAAEQTVRLQGEESVVLNIVEHIFVSIFSVELLLRIMSDRRRVLSDSWFWLDLLLVAIAVIANWILPLLGFFFSVVADGSVLGVSLVLRTARLARVVRAVRLFHSMSQLWLLVHAFLTSTRMVGYVLVVVALVLYIFNAIALELMPLRYRDRADVPEHVQEVIDTMFSSLGDSMLTLMQFLCLDSTSAIYRPLAQFDWILAVYFVVLVTVVGVILMNVITAAIVNTALHQGNEDKELRIHEERRRKSMLIDDLYGLFVRLDTDNSGQLSLQELMEIEGEDMDLVAEFSGDMDPAEVFRMLDVDRSGTLGIYEFCEGLYEVAIGSRRVELRNLTRHVHHIVDVLAAHHKQMDRIQESIDTVSFSLAEDTMLSKPGEIAPSGKVGNPTAPQTAVMLTTFAHNSQCHQEHCSKRLRPCELPIERPVGHSPADEQAGTHSAATADALLARLWADVGEQPPPPTADPEVFERCPPAVSASSPGDLALLPRQLEASSWSRPPAADIVVRFHPPSGEGTEESPNVSDQPPRDQVEFRVPQANKPWKKGHGRFGKRN